jgi:hypothetical protein
MKPPPPTSKTIPKLPLYATINPDKPPTNTPMTDQKNYSTFRLSKRVSVPLVKGKRISIAKNNFVNPNNANRLSARNYLSENNLINGGKGSEANHWKIEIRRKQFKNSDPKPSL